MGFVISDGVVLVLVLGVFMLNCFTKFGTAAQPLARNEVKALEAISRKLTNLNWRVDEKFCSGVGSMNRSVDDGVVVNNITCDCSLENGTVCSITNIQLKGLNLSGALPAEFGNLTNLRQLDLSRNYISGPIPTSFAQLPLVNLSLLGNRLNGGIPKEIGDIGSLEDLILEDNQLDGPLPKNLGNLINLSRLLLSSNYFTDPIPENYGSLKNLTDLIDGNRISGRIPDFIGNWRKLRKLYLEGTSMEGPIPSTISQLTNLIDLRISDLKGSSSGFPNLQDLKVLKYLILRNCLITGSIPEYIFKMQTLKQLDLSFNSLSGAIPDTFENENLDYMFLTNNSLSGTVPNWILISKHAMDISYNSFSGLDDAVSCEIQSPVNTVSGCSYSESNLWCLKKDLLCSRKPQYYSLFINCGGNKTEFEGNTYEQDVKTEGASHFSSYSDKWAYSSTGIFMSNSEAPFIANKLFSLNVTGPEIYKTARIAPLSLKYYALCLRKGRYKVKLYFAEIMFSDDNTFSSLGRRVFDVSIQGNLVLKDFNIVEAAGGVGKGIHREYDVDVSGSTLEIHLYWAGKGTTAIPRRGVYGPLISAIAVTAIFDTRKGLPLGAIAGIVFALSVLLVLILRVLPINNISGKEGPEDKERLGKTFCFTLRQIKAATSNFDPVNKIGEGGFGTVYKGVLSDGSVIAVKQLSSKSKQGNREFVNEIGMISALQHPNLVRLLGYCIEGKQLLLVYEYMENNSLARAIFGRTGHQLHLDWLTRKKICLGIARGLAYLHEESTLKIIHRDIKSTNVLLDRHLNAKISDFGLAKLYEEEEKTHITTRVAGTLGYMAPEYAMRGHLTDKADVYSFGIVTLEIISGKKNTNYSTKGDFVYLLDRAYALQEQGNLLELVDPKLGSNYCTEEATRMLNLALLCTNSSPSLRPSMSSAVSILEGKIPIQVQTEI